MSNKPLNQLIGSHSSICINDYIDDKNEQDELISKLVSGQSIRHVITKEKDNNIIYIDYTISPIRGDDGNISNYIATS